MENKYLFIILALLIAILLINFIALVDGSAAQKMLAKISAEKSAKTNNTRWFSLYF